MGKITSRTALTTAADGDIVHVVDVSDTTDSPQGTSKKSTLAVIRKLFGNTYEAELTIATGAVLTLNGTPAPFGIPAAIGAYFGAGKAIQLICASRKLTFNSVAYTTNTNLRIRAVGATGDQATTGTAGLNASATNIITFALAANGSSATDTFLVDGADLEVYVPTNNPAAGNSPIKLYIFFRIITL